MPEKSKFDFEKKDQEKFQAEREKKFVSTTYIDLARHGNRFGGPIKVTLNKFDGELIDLDDKQELTPRGRTNSQNFGSQNYLDASLVHPRGGGELRHGQSGEDILKGSGKFGQGRQDASPILFNKDGKTTLKGSRKGTGIDYTSAGVSGFLKEAKTLINDTLQNLVNDLNKEDQIKFKTDPEFRAQLREQAQVTGLKSVIDAPDEASMNVVKTLAEIEAYELMHDVELSRRGVKEEKPKAITLVGSGLFAESLFKYALVIEDTKTGSKTTGFKNVDDIGGFTKQASAFRIKLTRDNSKGDARNLEDFNKDTKVECEFIGDPDRAKIFENKKIYLDWNVVKKLAAGAERRFV